MTKPHDDLMSLVIEVFGDTSTEVASALSAVLIYKANPDNVDRLLKLMKEDGFNFPSGADKIAILLKQRVDELETVNV